MGIVLRWLVLLLIGLLIFGASVLSTAYGAPSVRCPVINTAVSRGASVVIDVSSCDGPYDAGMSGPIAPFAAHGTVSIGPRAFGAQSVTYAHGGGPAALDTFLLEDNDLGVVTVNVTIQAAASLVVVAPGTLPALVAGTPFSQALTASGGTGPYTFAVEAGSTLPAGLSLASDGLLAGTPTHRGGFAFNVRATDSLGAFLVKGYAGTVQNPSLSITPASLTVIQGVAYSQQLAVSGGVAPYTVLLESGSLPPGSVLSTTGLLSGTPSSAGAYVVTLRLHDSSAGTAPWFEFETFTMTVSPPPSVSIAVSPASVAENGTANLVFTVTRSASLNAATVVNLGTTGTATAGEDYTGSVPTVTIPAGATSATITIDPGADATPEGNETVILTVLAGTGYTVGAPSSATGTILDDDVTVTLSPATLPAADRDVPYSQSMSASGGTGPYAFTVTAGALPTGLSLTVAGVLSGTPTTAGTFDFSVTATDSSPFPGPFHGTVAYSIPVTILPTTATLSGLAINAGTLVPAFASGTTAYAVSVEYAVTTISLKATATDPQAGITVNGNAVGSGSPTPPIALAPGSNAITIVVTSRDGSATLAYTLAVTRGKLAQAIVFGAAPSIAVGSSGPVSATGGASGNPVVFSSLAPAVCTISGGTVTGLAEGNCVVAANQAGNAEYDAAPQATQSFTVAPSSTLPRLGNISTRLQVLTGDNVMIGGFIIGGAQAKTVVVRARGPSLAAFGIANPLANPLLQLFSGATQIAVNDNWREAANQAALAASGFAPADDFEAAILTSLEPGAYTAIVTGVGGGTGVGIVEVFEVNLPQVPLLNISTRGAVLTGENVMIGGFVIQGAAPRTVIIRARGPSLAEAGVPGALTNPLLQLFAGATPIAVNDNWQDGPDAAVIEAAGFAPLHVLESAIRVTLAPGAYTAIVTGAGGATGVAIVEVFAQ